jgi:predicted TIM-barrel fold metal-dependent hydrolase
MLSALDVEWSTRELERCARFGFKGAILPSALPEAQSYASQTFDPLWKVAQDLNLPICFHENTPQGKARAAVVQSGKLSSVDRGRSRIRAWIEPQITLVDLIFGRVLERFPSLQFVFAEYELCWVGIVLKTDRAVGRSRSLGLLDQTPTSLPSEYMRRQIHITFQQDRIGILGTEVFGLDNYMWSSDYPHGGSSWPKSQQLVEAVLKGLPVEAQQRLLWQNGAKLYGLS